MQGETHPETDRDVFVMTGMKVAQRNMFTKETESKAERE